MKKTTSHKYEWQIGEKLLSFYCGEGKEAQTLRVYNGHFNGCFFYDKEIENLISAIKELDELKKSLSQT